MSIILYSELDPGMVPTEVAARALLLEAMQWAGDQAWELRNDEDTLGERYHDAIIAADGNEAARNALAAEVTDRAADYLYSVARESNEWLREAVSEFVAGYVWDTDDARKEAE